MSLRARVDGLDYTQPLQRGPIECRTTTTELQVPCRTDWHIRARLANSSVLWLNRGSCPVSLFSPRAPGIQHDHGMTSRISTGLVHDYLLVMRGGERTFAAIADCWPKASIYTLLFDDAGTDRRFHGRTVRTSYLQHLGIRQNGFRRLLPLYPRATASLPVQDHDLVISSSSAFAHGVRPASGRRAHLLLPHPVPLRMARAGARPRGGAARGAAAAARRAEPHAGLGPRGLHARHPLRGQLADHPRADRADLGSRLGDRAPAGGGQPLRDRAAPRTSCSW